MSKTKWNYAVVRSIFGDLWIGKTKLPIGNKVFNNFTDAVQRAEMLFEDMHIDFDLENEDNNDMELQEQYISIVEALENEVEKIEKTVEKFIV